MYRLASLFAEDSQTIINVCPLVSAAIAVNKMARGHYQIRRQIQKTSQILFITQLCHK